MQLEPNIDFLTRALSGRLSYRTVKTCTIVCSDIVGARAFRDSGTCNQYTRLLYDHAQAASDVFAGNDVYAVLADSVFVAVADAREAVNRAIAFHERLAASGIGADVAVGVATGPVTTGSGEGLKYEGPVVAYARGLAHYAAPRGIFVDESTASAIRTGGITSKAGATARRAADGYLSSSAVSAVLPKTEATIQAFEIIWDTDPHGAR